MIGLIVAMRREAQPLLRLAGPSRGGTIAGLESRCFTLHGAPCILVYCGIGMERARAAAAAFIRAVSPSLLVSFGISGSVEEDLQVGDVVVAERSLLHGGDAPPQQLLAATPEELAAVERAVAEQGASTFRGSVVTTRGESVHSRDAAGLPHPVLDMETWAIAQEAARQDVPLLSVRGLSDSVREPLPFDLTQMTDAGGTFRAGRLLWQAACHPGMLRRLSRLQANTRRAEENVTAAVVTLLSFRGSRTPQIPQAPHATPGT